MTTYSPNVIARLAAYLIYPVAFIGFMLESGARLILRNPDYYFRYVAGLTYGLATTVIASLCILYGNGMVTCIGIYILSAWELLALWSCLCIAVGKKSKIRAWLRELARRKPKPGPFLFTAKWLYLVLASYLFTIYYFSCLYCTINKFKPLAFSPQYTSSIERLFEFIYYSTVTIATVGYGDILPVTISARALTVIEIILGVFFHVFLFGILISFHINRAMQSNLKEIQSQQYAEPVNKPDRE